jgi:competence protein ComEC
MNIWSQYPLLRILIPLISGVLLAWYLPFTFLSPFLLLLPFAFFLLWIFRPKVWKLEKFRYAGVAVGVLIFVGLGFFLAQSKKQINYKSHFANHDTIEYMLVRIEAPLTNSKKTFKTQGQVLAAFIRADSSYLPSIGKLMLYFQKNDSIQIHYGDELLIDASRVSEIKSMGNPNEFDYEKYMNRLQFYHQVYLTHSDWVKTGKNDAKKILEWSFLFRTAVLELLESFDFSESDYAVASAILVGYDELLDQDLRQLYAGSGAMHILCVSGLHVGILFLLLSVLLKPFDSNIHTKKLKIIIILAAIWFYALVTGLSPSVIRAATMFSFISFGQFIHRKTSVYNSLTASAIVLIIFDPYVIFHIGFQLSYTAILGILIVQPMLSSLWNTNFLVLKYFRDLLAVSIAAQIGTFPISIFYFHIFPNFFFITNLFVIPWSFLILLTGFFTLITEFIGLGDFYILSAFKIILEFLLSSLNFFIEFINDLPFSSSTQLYLNLKDVYILYLVLFLTFSSILLKRIKNLIMGLSLFTIMMIWNGKERFDSDNESNESFVIYNIPKNSLAEYRNKNQTVLIGDSSVVNRKSNFARFIDNFNFERRIKKTTNLLLDTFEPANNVLHAGQWHIAILENKTPLQYDFKDVNFLWIRNNPYISPDIIIEKIKPEIVITDATNSYWTNRIWERSCDSIGIPFHNVQQNGAFIINKN